MFAAFKLYAPDCHLQISFSFIFHGDYTLICKVKMLQFFHQFFIMFPLSNPNAMLQKSKLSFPSLHLLWDVILLHKVTFVWIRKDCGNMWSCTMERSMENCLVSKKAFVIKMNGLYWQSEKIDFIKYSPWH